MNDMELCYLPVTEILSRYKSKKLSPVEYLQTLIKRTEEIEPKINAFSATYFDEALEQAKAAEQKYVNQLSDLRPLEGIPIALKDEVGLAGKITTEGSLLQKDSITEENGYIVDRLQDAGAIFHARTATPEFCCAAVTHSRIHGVTRNPWNTDITVGGSSGGSGASLAAGTAPMASGSDIGGSIRIPSSMNGIVGFKPPYGRNPEESKPFNLDTYNHQGPMARNVKDCILMQNIISGPHPKDIATIKPKINIPLDLDMDLKGWRIAYSINLGFYEVEPDVIKNTHEVLDVFRSLGAVVDEVDLGWTDELEKASANYLGHLFGNAIDAMAQEYGDLMTSYALAFAETGKKSTSMDFLEAQVYAGEMYDTFGPMMEKYDVFICPTTATTNVKADHDPQDPYFTVNGKKVDAMLSWCMTPAFNMLSRCPVLAVPSGFGNNGVPTGIQIVGRTYEDETVFRAAAALEKEKPWYGTPTCRPYGNRQ
ncbi:MAG: amidase [Desulfobacterales bacterium]|nr:amidase [Desulfobacterales bacterium]